MTNCQIHMSSLYVILYHLIVVCIGYNIRNVVRETNELLKNGNQTIIFEYTRNESISTGGVVEFSGNMLARIRMKQKRE